jgi:hypothetical protein
MKEIKENDLTKNMNVSFSPPKIGSGRYKNQYATVNTLPYWYRYQKTKIKNSFKEMLRNWYFPESEITYDFAEITFKIIKPTKIRQDPDAFGASAYKWAIDTLVEQKYIIDDMNIRIILEPTELGNKKISELTILMNIELKNNMIE